MRVFLTTDTVGGVWDHTVTLARELHATGCELLVAVLGEPRDERLAHLPEGVEVTWRPYRLEWMPDAQADVTAAGEWLRRTAALWQAEVVHLNQMAYAVEDFGAPKVVAVHSDVLSWFREVQGRDVGPEWERYARWVREGVAAADAVVTPTAYQSALVGRHYGRAADRVIHNGVVPPRVADRADTAPVLLTVGRAWDPAKGVGVLDEAVKLLRNVLGDACPPAHLLGETTAPHGERFTARHLAQHGRVERAEVDEWLGRATVYVGASLYEPFGLAPLEAAFHGCALVLSDIGSFRELWEGCAAFFPRGDAAGLAEVLAGLCDDPKHRARLAAAARKRAERRYTAARMAGDYLALYHELRAARAAKAARKLVSTV